MREVEDLVGKRFNNLEVVKYLRKSKTRGHMWRCVCTVQRDGKKCANERLLSSGELRAGVCKMCHECGGEASRKHRQHYSTTFVFSKGAS